MKYDTGSYRIIIFGEYGNKIKSKKASGFINARKKIDKYLKKHPTNSAVMTHILWNSKDKNNKWDYTDDAGQRNGSESKEVKSK